MTPCMIPTSARANGCLIRFQTGREKHLLDVRATSPQNYANRGRRVGASVYRVYYVQDTVEHYEGFYETQEEAEEVAECVSDDYEAERVEVRDRYDNILFVIGDETMVDG